MFGNNLVKGAGEGDINVEVEYRGKTTRIRLTNVMHVPEAEGKILSLKALAQKGFESLILADHFPFDSNLIPNKGPACRTLYLVVLVMQSFEATCWLPKTKHKTILEQFIQC